jgi:hypothetical protein
MTRSTTITLGGVIASTSRSRGATSSPRLIPATGKTKWRVGLIWPLEVVVVTAYVDRGYRYSIRCMADDNMVWILSRMPEMDDATYAEMLTRLVGMGFNVDRIHTQTPCNPGSTGLHAAPVHVKAAATGSARSIDDETIDNILHTGR